MSQRKVSLLCDCASPLLFLHAQFGHWEFRSRSVSRRENGFLIRFRGLLNLSFAFDSDFERREKEKVFSVERHHGLFGLSLALWAGTGTLGWHWHTRAHGLAFIIRDSLLFARGRYPTPTGKILHSRKSEEKLTCKAEHSLIGWRKSKMFAFFAPNEKPLLINGTTNVWVHFWTPSSFLLYNLFLSLSS